MTEPEEEVGTINHSDTIQETAEVDNVELESTIRSSAASAH